MAKFIALLFFNVSKLFFQQGHHSKNAPKALHCGGQSQVVMEGMCALRFFLVVCFHAWRHLGLQAQNSRKTSLSPGKSYLLGLSGLSSRTEAFFPLFLISIFYLSPKIICSCHKKWPEQRNSISYGNNRIPERQRSEHCWQSDIVEFGGTAIKFQNLYQTSRFWNAYLQAAVKNPRRNPGSGGARL